MFVADVFEESVGVAPFFCHSLLTGIEFRTSARHILYTVSIIGFPCISSCPYIPNRTGRQEFFLYKVAFRQLHKVNREPFVVVVSQFMMTAKGITVNWHRQTMILFLGYVLFVQAGFVFLPSPVTEIPQEWSPEGYNLMTSLRNVERLGFCKCVKYYASPYP